MAPLLTDQYGGVRGAALAVLRPAAPLEVQAVVRRPAPELVGAAGAAIPAGSSRRAVDRCEGRGLLSLGRLDRIHARSGRRDLYSWWRGRLRAGGQDTAAAGIARPASPRGVPGSAAMEVTNCRRDQRCCAMA